MARTRGWGDETIGKKTKRKPKQEDIELDLDMDLEDEVEVEGAEVEEAEEEDESDSVDDEMSALLDELDGVELEEEDEEKPKKKATKKVAKKAAGGKPRRTAKKKARKKAKADAAEDLIEELEPDEPSGTERAAKAIGADLKSECPVCRSLKDCDCTEEDRTFVRRVRFEAGVKTVARCSRCAAPLSTVYVRRPGVTGKHSLAQFSALWGCGCCQPAALAAALLGMERARPRSSEATEGED